MDINNLIQQSLLIDGDYYDLVTKIKLFMETERINEILPVYLKNIDNPNAKYFIAYNYFIQNDYNTAIKYFKESADQNNPIAQFIVGTLHDEGKHVTKNCVLALQYYIKSAKQGYSFALYKLGLMHYFGFNDKYLNKCILDAYEYFKLCSKTGDSDATRFTEIIQKGYDLDNMKIQMKYTESIIELNKLLIKHAEIIDDIKINNVPKSDDINIINYVQINYKINEIIDYIKIDGQKFIMNSSVSDNVNDCIKISEQKLIDNVSKSDEIKEEEDDWTLVDLN